MCSFKFLRFIQIFKIVPGHGHITGVFMRSKRRYKGFQGRFGDVRKVSEAIQGSTSYREFSKG